MSGDLYRALALLDDDELDHLIRLDGGLPSDEALETTDEDRRLVALNRHTLMRVKLLARSVDRPPVQVLDELAEHGVNSHDVVLGTEREQ
jgi:hypothetical protein